MSSVWNHICKYRLCLIIFVSSSVVSTAVSTVIPRYNGEFIDTLISSTEFDAVARFILIIVTLSVIGTVMLYVTSMSSVRLSSRSGYDDLSDTVSHLQKIPYDVFVSRFDPAYLMKRINTDIDTVYGFVIGNMVSVVTQGAVFAVSVCIIAAIDLRILLVTAIFIPLYIACYALLKRPLFARSLEFKEEQSRLHRTVYGEIADIQQTKADVSFENSRERGYRSFGSYYRSMLGLSRVKYLFSSADNIVGIMFQSVIIVLSGVLIVHGEMTVGQFTVVNSYFLLLIASVKYYFNLGSSYQDYRTSLHRLEELDAIGEEPNGGTAVGAIGTIELDHVSYTYPSAGCCAVRNCSTVFRSGEITAVTGPNGSGKTTLMNILMGMFQNLGSGNVRYDGIDVRDIDLYSVRMEQFSVLLQGGYSGERTVGELLNDRLGVGEKDIMPLCRMMGLEGLFLTDRFRITDHLNKKFGELSGGEKQRVRLFITFGRQKHVIILDEPVAALDAEGKRVLIKHLSDIRKGRVIIVVSHDADLIAAADRVLSMQPVDGKTYDSHDVQLPIAAKSIAYECQ